MTLRTGAAREGAFLNRSPGINRKARPHFDWTLTIIVFLLALFGVIAITAATYTYSEEGMAVDTLLARITSSDYGRRQGLFFMISPIVISLMLLLDYRFFQKFSLPLYLASLGLLVVLLAIGTTTSGVTGWFSLFSGYMLQPSEFAKITVILHLAKFFARKDNPVTTVREFVVMAVIMVLPVGLILAQGEMGTVMVFLAFYIGMMFMSGMRLRIIAGLLIGGVTALIPVVLLMQQSGSYRYERLISFIDPSQASADAIYQARNSQIAIGNGGVHGTGLFTNGTYTALNYVPQNHTDFIFSSIGETMGFMGCMLVIVLYMLLLLRMLSLTRHTYDKFARLVIVGMFTMLLFHIIYNIGMTIGVTPVMGIPLPFLSYGGSNLVANMAGIGLVLNITLRKPELRATNLGESVTTGLFSQGKTRRMPRDKKA